MTDTYTDDDPWMQAWRKLKAFIENGASKQELTAYAHELARDLPDTRDPVAYAKQAEAMEQVVREIMKP